MPAGSPDTSNCTSPQKQAPLRIFSLAMPHLPVRSKNFRGETLDRADFAGRMTGPPALLLDRPGRRLWMHCPTCCAPCVSRERYFSTFRPVSPGWLKLLPAKPLWMRCFRVRNTWFATTSSRAGAVGRAFRASPQYVSQQATSSFCRTAILTCCRAHLDFATPRTCRLWFSRLRRAAVQSPVVGIAARHFAVRTCQRCARFLRSVCIGRVKGTPIGRSVRARSPNLADVGRRNQALSGDVASRSHRLAGRLARPIRRGRIVGVPSKSNACLDHRVFGEKRGIVEVGAGRALYRAGRAAPRAIYDQLAHAARSESLAERHGQC